MFRGVALLLLAAALPAAAQSERYGPFGPTEHHFASLSSCDGALELRGGFTSSLAPGDHVPPIDGRMDYQRPGFAARLRFTIDDEAFAAQIFVGEDPRTAPIPFAAASAADFGKTAICDDLNRDGVTDFVATIWHHGNGLGAEFYQRFVALSNGAGYRFWTLETMSPEQEDFVTFGPIEPIVMVTREFVQARRTEHYFGTELSRSYFVHDLWAFHGSEVVPVNSIDARFPVWVRYTSKPNHQPAKSVSAAEKLELRPAVQVPVELRP